MFETDVIIVLYSVWAALSFTIIPLESTLPNDKRYDFFLAVAVHFVGLSDLYLHPDHLDLHGILASLLLSAGLLVCFEKYCVHKLGQENENHFRD